MAVDAVSLPRSQALGVREHLAALPAGVIVASLIGASALLRFIAALPHTTPRYFPDEYIYAELGRSLADGRLEIREAPVRFPALLESLLTAPLWLVDDVELSLRLVQGLHAVVASLVAVPVYLLARRLGLPAWQQITSAALVLALPSLLFASYLTADALGLLLAVTSIFAAVVALDRPTSRNQVAFFAVAGLATFARVQYVVLIPTFLLGALALERFRPVAAARRYRLSAILVALAAIVVIGLGPGRALGYYEGVLDIELDAVSMARWAATDLMLLAYAAGLVLVPAALVGLSLGVVRPQSRTEHAFAVMAAGLTAFLMLEAALYVLGTERFQERYLIALGPLVPLLFFLGCRRLEGRRARHGVTAVALAFVVVAVRSPLAGYTAGDGSQDSPVLQALSKLESLAGIANGALVVSLVAVALLLVSVAAAYRPKIGAPLAAALAFVALVVASTAAVATDVQRTQGARALFPTDARWVDHHELGDVRVLVTPGTLRAAVSAALFWNTSLVELLQMNEAEDVDAFGSTRVRVASDGTLRAGGRPVTGGLMVQEYASNAELGNARLVQRDVGASLWDSADAPIRLTMLTHGRYLDGWLSWPKTEVTVWPGSNGRRQGVLCLDLRMPESSAGKLLFVAGRYERSIRVAAGERRLVAIPVSTALPWTMRIGAERPLAAGMRLVSALSERPRFVEGPVGPQGPESRCR